MRFSTGRSARLALGALLAAGCAAPAQFDGGSRQGPSPGGWLSAAETGAMVAEHNRWRAQVDVGPLRWSDALASSAQTWADRLALRGCRLEHQRGSGVGENLFKASPQRGGARGAALAPVTAFDVVGAWGAEVRDYSPRSNRCQLGRTCGHYTQIVWRATQEVGCGMAVCADLGQIWVCNYRPAGNVAGRWPY